MPAQPLMSSAGAVAVERALAVALGRLAAAASVAAVEQAALDGLAEILATERVGLLVGAAPDGLAREVWREVPEAARPALRRLAAAGRPARRGGGVGARAFALLDGASSRGSLVALAAAFDAARQAAAASFAGHAALALARAERADATLREARFFHSIVEGSTSVTLAVAWSGLVRYASPSIAVLGYRPDEVVGRSLFEWMHTEDLQRLVRSAEHDPATRVWRDSRFRLRHRDGSWRYFEAIGGEIPSPAGPGAEAPLFIVQGRDVTRRVRAEQGRAATPEMRELARRSGGLAELFALAYELASELFSESGFEISLLERVRGGRRPRLVDRFQPASRARPLQNGLPEYVLRTGQALLASSRRLAELESAGEIVVAGRRPCCWLGVPLATPDETLGVLAVAGFEDGLELTERELEALGFIARQMSLAIETKRAEDELRRSEEELRTVLSRASTEWQFTFDAIEHPIFLLEADGRVRRMNRAGMLLAGGGFRSTLGRRLAELGQGEIWPAAAGLAAAALAAGAPQARQLREAAGGRTWDLAANPVRWTGEESDRVIVTAHDVSETFRLQESLRRSEMMSALGALVGGVAHEVRNPLFVLGGALNAFAASCGNCDFHRDYLQLFGSQLDRLNSLMHSLLEYGKPRSGELAPGRVGEVIELAAADCAAAAAAAGVEVRLAIAADLPPVAMSRERLTQVFDNLIENAVQHSPRGAAVRVRAAAVRGADGERVRCTVEDQGPGFRLEDLPRLFEPFFSRRRGGTGLGLSIVQRIVEEHAGRVHAAGAGAGVGVGAVMVVDLPALPRGGTA